MDDKNNFIAQYQKFRATHSGTKPLLKDFLVFCNMHKRKLEGVFGKDAYSKLQQECGDIPNKLQLERTPVKLILDQYGSLVRKCGTLPVTADWLQAKFKPSTDAINKVHNLKWTNMPTTFIEEYSNSAEWKDVIEILKTSTKEPKTTNANKAFNEIVEKLDKWKPDRKRIIEEGYKIELRSYLEKYYHLEEEVGETNADLLVNKKIPIEIKKDPTQSEYDRLLGQMIRHNKLFGSAIAVIVGISSEDRFRKFQKLFIEVHDKLGMTAELLNK